MGETEMENNPAITLLPKEKTRSHIQLEKHLIIPYESIQVIGDRGMKE